MRLIVVDDDRLVVDSLKIILGAQPQIEVVGTGANGNDAVALYAEHAPDIALLDIQMPGRDGLSAAREILERDPSARVVFLTTFSDDEYIVSALKLGARGYLIKTDVAAIPPALAQVMAGKRVLEGKAIEDVDFDGANAEAGATHRPAASTTRKLPPPPTWAKAPYATTSARSLPKWACATARRSPLRTCEGNYPTADRPGIAKWLQPI